jgi:hypothetical protein
MLDDFGDPLETVTPVTPADAFVNVVADDAHRIPSQALKNRGPICRMIMTRRPARFKTLRFARAVTLLVDYTFEIAEKTRGRCLQVGRPNPTEAGHSP